MTMVGARLPQVAELAGDAKSYAERLFKFPRIGSLSNDDAAVRSRNLPQARVRPSARTPWTGPCS